MKVLINYEIAKAFTEATGIETIPLHPYSKLDTPVSCHADMLFCKIDNKIFCYEDYVKQEGIYDSLLDAGCDVVFVSKPCGKQYPRDVLLNVLIVGDTLFCNIENTASEILEYARLNGYKTVNVKQGYSACSTIVIDENSAITADAGIYRAISSHGKECLLIDGENIYLNGYNCGFCGGASGVFGDTVYFFGDATTLKSYNKIFEYLSSKKIKIFSILSGRVYDFGGFKLI